MKDSISRPIEHSKAVEVYWNIPKGGWSVRQSGLVCAHLREIRLRDCTLVINDRLRAAFDAKDSRRTVHAWVKGFIVTDASEPLNGEIIRYNPFQMRRFQRATNGAEISRAQVVHFHEDRHLEARGVDDPESVLRDLWTAKGVPVEQQDRLFAQIAAGAQPGARVGPFVIPQ